MIVARNPEKEWAVLDELVASFSRPLPEVTLPAEEQLRGDEVHISDLLKVRQAFWSRELPLPLTHTEALNFTTGRAHEEIMHRRVKLPGWRLGERRFVDGIQYRPDIDWMARPTEFKTRIRNLARPGEETITYDGYLEQLQAYCALDRLHAGHLVVLSLAEGMDINNVKVPTHRELAIYDVTFSEPDLATMRQHLIVQRDAFLAARKAHAGQELRLCPEWMCGKPVMVEPPKCAKCETQHRSDRPDGHVMSKPKFEYQSRCKWYVFCEPWKVDATRQPR